MSDETTSATTRPAHAPSDPTAPTAPMDEPAELLAAMRTQLEEATADIERLTAELAERTRALAEVEAVADAVLGATDAVVVVVGGDRRVRALSRGAAAAAPGGGSPVGRPLSAVVDDEGAAAVGDRLDAAADAEAPGPVPSGDVQLGGGRRMAIDLLDDGSAVLVLREP